MAPAVVRPDDDHDVIVVGGGHNGMICAAYLARAGVDTLVVEARDEVGGCASTVDAIGARVNICSCDHSSIRSMPVFDELELAHHGLEYLDLDPALVAMDWSGGRPYIAFADVDRTIESMRFSHPDDVEGFEAYLACALPALELALAMAQAPPTPRNVLPKLAQGGSRGASTMLRWSRKSAAEVLDTYFTSETLKGVAVANGPAVWGVSPHMPGTGAGALAFAMRHAIAPGRPIGGSGAMTEAVRRSFEAAGGRVQPGSPVHRLLVEDERVVGVETIGGDVVRAATVIVACDPRVALLQWLSDPPPAAAKFLDRWRNQPELDGYESKLDAVIDQLPRYVDIDQDHLDAVGVEDPLVPTAIIAPTVDAIAAAHGELARGRVAERPIFLANVPSVPDPTMALADGAHVLSLETLFTPYAFEGGWDTAAEGERWLEAFASKVQPGFLTGIRDFRVVSPVDYERDFGMPRGYAQSYGGGPLAALLGRRKELSRYETPIDGLFLTGAATFPGAGIWGASGRNTAHVVLGHLDR